MPKFDVIVGNPPYHGEKRGGGDGSGNAIWQKFVELSFKLTKDNGHIAMIHPIHWRTDINRKKIKNAQDLLFNHQIIYLKTFQTPFPGIATVVDWYILKKIDKYKKTIISAENTTYEKYLEKQFITNQGGNIVDDILNKVFSKNNGLYKRKAFGGLTIFDKNAPLGNYKFIHGMKSITQNIFKYYNYPHIHQYMKKVIIPDLGLIGHYDDGKLGIGDHVHYVLVNNENEANFLLFILQSNVMIFLQRIFSTDIWVGNLPKRWNNPYPISMIKIDDKELKTNIDVYRHFNLTQEEIDYIESQIK